MTIDVGKDLEIATKHAEVLVFLASALSVGMVTVYPTVTDVPGIGKGLVATVLVLFVISILLGLVSMGKIVKLLRPPTDEGEDDQSGIPSSRNPHLRLFSFGQMATYFGGVLLLVGAVLIATICG